MNFSCDRCHKRFTTSDQPVPGRTYRIPCACGNTIVLEIAEPGAEGLHEWSADRPYTTPPGMYRLAGPRDPDPFVATDEGAARHDPLGKPIAPVAEARGAAASIPDVTPTFVGTLARRDPNATLDESSEYRLTGAVSFDDILRRTRRQGFLAGVAAGAAAGAVAAVALIVAMARFSDAPAAPPEAPAPAARAPDVAPPLALPSPAPSPPSLPPPSPPRSVGEGRGEGAERPTARTGSRAKAPAPVREPEKALPPEIDETPAAASHAARNREESPDREAIDPAGAAPAPEQEPAPTTSAVQPPEDRDADPEPPTEGR